VEDAERREQGLRLLHQMLGPEQAERVRRAWQEICPDFEEYVVRFLSGEVWSRPGLDRRTKSLVTVAALAALGRPLGLELNIRMALNNGATEQEVVETLLHLAPYAGFPACWEGLALAHKVFNEPRGGAGGPPAAGAG
jgi:alkylhydroperoxidase/carboxymuconolactone decarboxylase family protein YurZ